MAFLLVGYGAHLIARTADQGLANLAGKVTLRHGTNPLSWLSIHLFGAAPHFGGSKFGGDYQYSSTCGPQNWGRFYMANDSDYYCDHQWETGYTRTRWAHWPRDKLRMRKLPRQYACSSTCNLLLGLPLTPKVLAAVAGILNGLLLPTIKIRLAPERVRELSFDRTLAPGEAVSTDHWIPPFRMGLAGTLWSSLTHRTPLHMLRHPTRVAAGAIQLTLAGAATYGAVSYLPAIVAAHKTAILVGAFLAVI